MIEDNLIFRTSSHALDVASNKPGAKKEIAWNNYNSLVESAVPELAHS